MSDAFNKLYSDIATRKGEAHKTGPYAGGNGRIDRAVDIILDEEQGFPTSGTLLDVGGATGNLGYALRDYFQTRITLDISEECREPAVSKGNIFIKTNVDQNGFFDENLDFWVTDGQCDLIVSLDFIEHILDPVKFAKECMRSPRPGGHILINTPNIQFWRHLESLVVDGVFPHTSGDREVYHGGHVAFFNLHDMKTIFGGVGFKECRMITRGLEAESPPPIWQAISKVGNLQLSYPDLIFSARRPI